MNPAELDDDGRRLLNQLFGKWSLLVLDALCKRPQRFSELRQHLLTVTPKSLTACLQQAGARRHGRARGRVHGARGDRVRRHPPGPDPEVPLQAMMEWFVDHLDEVEAARSDYDEQRQPS